MTQQNNNDTNGTPTRPTFGRPVSGGDSSSAPSRFGQRPGFGSPQSNPFAANRRAWTVQPLLRTVVRFELYGLGDPFYRLLPGQTMNPTLGSDRKALFDALEAQDERTQALHAHLDAVWAGFNLTGAALVYPWNPKTWQAISQPTQPETQTDDDGDGSTAAESEPQPPLFNAIRALDPGLVLNVLARSRKQLLLANAPLLLNRAYINRSVITDDPRLVALAQATGFIKEGG